jgi:DNA polymerase III subunit epsilon
VRSEAASAYRAARLPARRTPWREAAFCVVDVEATGLDPRRDAIIAWSAVPVDGGRVVLAGAREGLARPPGEVPAESIRIHGLRELDLAGAPAPEQAADALLEAMSGRVLVAHAAWVERAFLGRLLRARGARLRGPVGDTSLLGRLWLSERDGRAPPTLSLAVLATALGLPVHRPHRATGDALTTAQAFIALAALLGDETVRSLADAGHRLEARRRWALPPTDEFSGGRRLTGRKPTRRTP